MVKWNRARLSVLHTQGEHNREAIRMMKWNKKIILLNYVLIVCFYEFPFHFRFFSLYWPRTNTLLYLKQRCCQWRWQFQDLEVSSPEKLICMIILAILLTGWWISCNIKKYISSSPPEKNPIHITLRCLCTQQKYPTFILPSGLFASLRFLLKAVGHVHHGNHTVNVARSYYCLPVTPHAESYAFRQRYVT